MGRTNKLSGKVWSFIPLGCDLNRSIADDLIYLFQSNTPKPLLSHIVSNISLVTSSNVLFAGESIS